MNFDLEIFNTPPFFTGQVPIDATIKFNNTIRYKLPKFAD